MPIRIDDRKEITKTKTVLADGEPITAEYRPSAVTLAFERDMRNLEKQADADLAFTALFCQVVKSWDVEYSEGNPVPIEPEALLAVPVDILLAVLGGIRKEDAPGEATSAPLPVSSFGADAGKISL